MRRLALLAAVGAIAISGGTASFAATPSPAKPAGHAIGIVPLHGASRTSSHGNLSYHGGPVEHTNTVYLLFWNPGSRGTFATGYQNVVQQYFTDVAADTTANKSSNVYYAATQYSDGTGHVGIATTVGGTATSTDSPPSGCSDSGTSYCVTDAQIQSEVQTQAAALGWATGPNTEIFVFTAKGIGSCAGSQCAFSYYCAYHSWIGSGSAVTLYANMPYADTNSTACGTGQKPNNNDADDTINVTSHEHNETLTDEQGNAWFDRQGAEDGDKCAWTFGSALGGTSGHLYNQLINGHGYYLQREWSNASSGCVLQGT